MRGMVSFTLSLLLIFFTKILTSSGAILVVTNVTLNSSESSIVETSNDTVLLTNKHLLNGQNADSTIGTNGSQPQPNLNPQQTMDRVNNNLTLPENDSFVVDLSNSSLVSQINDSSTLNNSHQLPERKMSAIENFPTDFIPESVSILSLSLSLSLSSPPLSPSPSLSFFLSFFLFLFLSFFLFLIYIFSIKCQKK